VLPVRHRWRVRPLREEQRAYAAIDVEVLLELHDLFAPLLGAGQERLFG